MFNAMKKIVSFVIVLAAVAMVGCRGRCRRCRYRSFGLRKLRREVRFDGCMLRREGRFDQGLLREIVLREGRGKQVVAG